ncbi:MAG TPA: aldo/keto reductase family protein [Planctomycetota bacterium]|nr:aldo/keto reductase family protein [Planctomycetota bacterium]
MRHRRVGRSGLQTGVVGLGAWLTFGQSVDQAATTRILRAALDGGVTFLDTADVYGTGAAEAAWGVALEGAPREHYVLATKAFFPMSAHRFDRGLSRKHLCAALDASLRRLRTPYVDLYQCHRFDPETPVEEVVRTMDDFVSAGKIRHWGVSCWTAAQIEEAVRLARGAGREPPISNQPPYNLLDRAIEAEVLPKCRELGLSQVVFSPLAQGALTGKYLGGRKPPGSRAAQPRIAGFMDRYFEPQAAAATERLAAVAAQAGMPLGRLALAWCLRDENVASVIVGATSEAQLAENLAAADVVLAPDVLAAIDRALSPVHGAP